VRCGTDASCNNLKSAALHNLVSPRPLGQAWSLRLPDQRSNRRLTTATVVGFQSGRSSRMPSCSLARSRLREVKLIPDHRKRRIVHRSISIRGHFCHAPGTAWTNPYTIIIVHPHRLHRRRHSDAKQCIGLQRTAAGHRRWRRVCSVAIASRQRQAFPGTPCTLIASTRWRHRHQFYTT
jgi:hypothetical protein